MKQMLDGTCSCGELSYRLLDQPLIVHCCHCSWCQRETGSAFAINAMIETHLVSVVHGKVARVLTPSNSGKGQIIARCPRCQVALWSHYAGAGETISFVRVGTLLHPHLLPPDIHIFTSTKQPWVVLPESTPAVSDYYQRSAYWPESSLERWQKLREASS